MVFEETLGTRLIGPRCGSTISLSHLGSKGENMSYCYRRIGLCLIILAASAFLCDLTVAEELPSIFNGKDFAGWKVPKQNTQFSWWKVENGILRATSDPRKKGSILWTEKQYGNFVLELEFKMGEGRVDSGVFLRNENDQIQIGDSGKMKRDMTASPYIASEKGYPVEAEGVKESLKLKDWNRMTIVAKGSEYTVWLNDSHVMHYVSATASEKGSVGLQLHPGRDMVIEYRNLRLAELR